MRLFPAATLLLLLAPAARAADPPPALKGVPADAAVVVYAEVSKLWAGPVGASVRATGADDGAVAAFREAAGFGPEDVAAVAVVVPDLRAAGGLDRFAVRAVFKKPYDRARLARVWGATVDEKAGRLVRPDGPPEVVVDVSDPLAVVVRVGAPAETLTAAAAAGPLSGAFAAAGPNSLVVGVNWAKLPPLPPNLPAEAKPFLPLAAADAWVLTGRAADDGSMPLELLASAADPDRAKAAGPALRAALTFLRTVAAVTAAESGKEVRKQFQMRDPLGPLEPVMAALEPALAAAAVRDTPAGPVLAVTLPADAPLGPLVRLAAEAGSTLPRSGQAELTNNFKQVALALHNHLDAVGKFPPSAGSDKPDKPLLSWRVAVLPYIEQGALYQQFKLDEPWDSPANRKVLESNPMPPVFALPGVTKPGEKLTHVQVFTGNGAAFEPARGMKINDFTDGTSNTLLVVLGKTPVEWTRPDDIRFDPKADPRPVLLFTRGVTVAAYADGSVRTIGQGADPAMLRGVITRAGGEVVAEDTLSNTTPPPTPKPKPPETPEAAALKRVGLAMHGHHDVYGTFPPEALVNPRGTPMLSWRVAVLPWLGDAEGELYKKFRLHEPWDSAHNKALLKDMPAAYALPGDKREAGMTRVRAFAGNGALFDGPAPRLTEVTDGLSNTVMATLAAETVEWTKPGGLPFDPQGDPGKLLFRVNGATPTLFADGAVRLIPAALPAATLRALITRAGGEVAAPPEGAPEPPVKSRPKNVK